MSNSPQNYLSKDITQIGNAKTISIYDTVDIISPVFVLDYSVDYLNCNYCYCVELHRYYHVVISLDSAKRMILTCQVDVLMTYRDDILQSDATVIRSESVGNPTYVVDDQLPIVQGRYIMTAQTYPNKPLNTDVATNTILITLGG